jgi:hypothetical protein
MHKLVIGVVAATLAIAACGGSSKKDTSAGGSGNVTTTAGKSTGGNTNTTAGGGDSGGGSSDLSKARIKVTYEEGSTDSKSMLTFALSGDGKSAFTDSEAGAAPSDVSTIYSDGTTNVDCQGTGPTATCTQLPVAEAGIASGITTGFSAIALVVATLGGGDKSSESIAGRDATCVKYKAADVISKVATIPIFKNSDDKASDYDPSDTFSICVDKKTGFPLKIAGTKKGIAQDGLIATAVSDPTDADFIPPSTPVTIPGAGSGSAPTIPAG